MTSAPRLAVESVSIRYGSLLAVRELSFAVSAGEMYALLGPNGSGKSSTLGAIAGNLLPTSGSIRVDGFCRRERPADYARLVGVVYQEPALYEELTARQNLELFGGLYGLRGRTLRDRIVAALERVDLADRADERLLGFSGGMLRRINLACALLHTPAVLLLDEPTVALDPESRDSLFDTLTSLRENGCAIVLTTHHLEEAEIWCDRVGILRKGRLIAEGRPADVLRRTSDRSIIHGQLREAIPGDDADALRTTLGPTVELRIVGRRLTLTADDGAGLGLALARLHERGVRLESFRTPPPRMACLSDEANDVGREDAWNPA